MRPLFGSAITDIASIFFQLVRVLKFDKITFSNCHILSICFLVLIPDLFGYLGKLKAFQKDSIKYMPIIGWNFWFTQNIFLKRQAQRDITRIQEGVKSLKESNLPFWLVLYAEGTRYTKEKHAAGEDFATQRGLPLLKHHIQPRPTGFTEVVKTVKSSEVSD